VTNQEIFVEEALVVTALPAARVEVGERIPAVLHAVEGGDPSVLRGLRDALGDAGLEGAEGGRTRERGRGGRGFLSDEGREQAFGLSCEAQLYPVRGHRRRAARA